MHMMEHRSDHMGLEEVVEEASLGQPVLVVELGEAVILESIQGSSILEYRLEHTQNYNQVGMTVVGALEEASGEVTRLRSSLEHMRVHMMMSMELDILSAWVVEPSVLKTLQHNNRCCTMGSTRLNKLQSNLPR